MLTVGMSAFRGKADWLFAGECPRLTEADLEKGTTDPLRS